MEPIKRTIPMDDGTKLFTQVYEKGSKVWLIATHGIGEHLQRHSYLVDLFGHDLNIFQYDLRGHGRSGGEKAYISDFKVFYQDLDQCIKYLREKYNMKHYILFGHSMGALITCGYAQKYFSDDNRPMSVIVNAPPVGIPGALGKIVDLVPDNLITKLSSFRASLPLGGMVDLKYLSHRQDVIDDYVSDDLNHMKLHSKLLLELVRESREVFSKKINSGVPSFCSYGSADGIVSPEAIDHYFKNVETNFELKVIEGAYHEIHNELDKYRLPYFEYLKSAMTDVLYGSESN
ncbi:alpha/beta fold hydrolase [Bacteriovorax sp. Seq25_V]|uniref:alpha/beta fold hydrolase n=1 Tax=Bacteriovorax sp. Seq25_V TaxID=1201288 RepID=UPI000389F7F5|nr:alpha/beta fold hydrolase [Bacteriovorax sp. Seq25_V]EQC46689.1 putative lysophospholipase [Bacteriovorax sp. Seq25_V]